jgi:hypothetical protein
VFCIAGLEWRSRKIFGIAHLKSKFVTWKNVGNLKFKNACAKTIEPLVQLHDIGFFPFFHSPKNKLIEKAGFSDDPIGDDRFCFEARRGGSRGGSRAISFFFGQVYPRQICLDDCAYTRISRPPGMGRAPVLSARPNSRFLYRIAGGSINAGGVAGIARGP